MNDKRMTAERLAEIDSWYVCAADCCGSELLQGLKAERTEVERLEAELVRSVTNALKCLTPACDDHTGENTPPFDEWLDRVKNRCPICDADTIERLQAELKAERDRGEKLQAALDDVWALPEKWQDALLAPYGNHFADELRTIREKHGLDK